ncbi:hypothetical protein Pan110_25430 [Gimesia panareensis]|nr:hypothetical protein Pan110_25430 [Gimesia panareensis]
MTKKGYLRLLSICAIPSIAYLCYMLAIINFPDDTIQPTPFNFEVFTFQYLLGSCIFVFTVVLFYLSLVENLCLVEKCCHLIWTFFAGMFLMSLSAFLIPVSLIILDGFPPP